MKTVLLLTALLATALAEPQVYFKETFEDGSKNSSNLCFILFPPSLPVASWSDRWTSSKHKSDYGKFELTAGKFYGDAEKDKGKESK